MENSYPYCLVAQNSEYEGAIFPFVKSGGCYVCEKENYTVTAELEEYGCVVRQTNTVQNTSDGVLSLSHVSSALVKDIGRGGKIPWYDDRRFTIHYCATKWQGEAQWRSSTLSEFGVYRASNHAGLNSASIESVGSWSTSKYYPLILIEDCELRKTWFFEIEGSCSWFIKIQADSADENAALSVEMNTAYSNHDGWYYELAQDEAYTATPAMYGVADGGREEATRAILDYKRKTTGVQFENNIIPVCFNDYMNCLWAMPTKDKLIPLIDKAAEAGCEIFCIDACWFKGAAGRALGDWVADESLFGDMGFGGLIDYIRSKNMTAGVWTELECLDNASEAYTRYNDCLLRRNGSVISDDRPFFDMRKEKSRKYLMESIDYLYGLGVRYIKNDYNHTVGIGCDGSNSYSEALRDTSLAFYSFIDEVTEKYPDLIIENCGSGAMRSDGGIMRHFHLLSTSDQEYCFNNPSILSGTMRYIQPEKAGIWSYPFPMFFDDRDQSIGEIFNASYVQSFADGEETVFNMVNSMLGVMYLSGHIECADEFNFSLIKESISVYKGMRENIRESYPIYPSGDIHIYKNGFFSFGLAVPDKNETYLAVWRIHSEHDTRSFDLSKWAGKASDVEVLYPPKTLKTEYGFEQGVLTVKLEKGLSARLFRIHGFKKAEE